MNFQKFREKVEREGGGEGERGSRGGMKEREREGQAGEAGHHEVDGQSQNTVPIASTQVAIKGIVQYSTRVHFLVEQSVARRGREHTLSASRVARRSVATSCTYVSAINTTNFIQCNCCVQT